MFCYIKLHCIKYYTQAYHYTIIINWSIAILIESPLLIISEGQGLHEKENFLAPIGRGRNHS